MAGLAAVLVTAAAASPAASQGAVLQPGQKLGDDAQLSDEATLSRYAYARWNAPIHSRPTRAGRSVGRLRFQTEDGFAEPYLLLHTIVDERGRRWVQVRVPGRPNGRTGWVIRGSLARMHVVRTQLTINRRTLNAVLRRGGRTIWSARVGVGAASTPTPSGRYIVRERFSVRQRGGPYGPFAFGTSAYSVLSDWPRGGVVGIHGTNAPGLIPGRPSHGCVRIRNDAIMRLARLMPLGTPILII